MKKSHYYKLGEYNLYHSEAHEVLRHNTHYSIEFKDRVCVIPIPAVTSEEGYILLSFIGIGFQLKLGNNTAERIDKEGIEFEYPLCTQCGKPTDTLHGEYWHCNLGHIITKGEGLCDECAFKRPGFRSLT